MPTYIIKLKDEKFNRDYYMEWSTVVDAPVTYGMNLEDFKNYYKNQYGVSGLSKLDARLERVEKTGTSGYPPFDNLQELVFPNRAGKGEKEIGLDEILDKYCRLAGLKKSKT